MPGYLIHAPAASTSHPWTPINSLKNSPVTIVLHCPWSGNDYIIPAQPPYENEETNYFDESNSNVLLGSTTLYELIKRVKSKIPALYLMEEHGGSVLTCGPNEVFAPEWETIMLCQLIGDKGRPKASSSPSAIPRVTLEDGREAVVVTIGTALSANVGRQSVVTRCLSKGNVYG